MILKRREESEELRFLRMLKTRVDKVDDSYLRNLLKGYQGEQLFDCILEDYLSEDWIVLNDLLLNHASTFFQLDSVLITSEKIYIFEVKNYEGDFIVEGDRWYTLGRTEIKNPLLQISRSETMLRKILKDLGYLIPVEFNLILINSKFHLYNSTPKFPVVYASQIKRYLNKLKENTKGKCTTRHIQLAKKLMELHIPDSPFKRIPDYTFEELQKGLVCLGCGGMIRTSINRKLGCKNCSFIENTEIAIYNSIIEFNKLFPNMHITTNLIQEWIGKVVSKRTVQRVLKKYCHSIGHAKGTMYSLNTPTIQVNIGRDE
ncbi:nuclease-related domain-containing protein [Sutcliffiella rhizosphaerae]|uniref:NERD domain-containing protein n=1 Tax=Sutcliffiella rhizosphaerae TaxID=2880967 RepID=A0ABM8YPJ4_9BACI|nr:nuclease-related domain-containing protein [Sutcliffiella rhizosphaerae]CAG9621815.1 hypothetical protein BACCIP111883_02588 [Sutcliffiella rhizosphaerae]